MHEAVITDLHESPWQNMLEKTSDEFKRRQFHGSWPVAFLFFVGHEYCLVVGFHPAVSDCHLKDIGGKIFVCIFIIVTDCLTVDIPGRFPGRGRDLRKQPCFLH